MVEFSIALLRKCDAAIHVVDVVNGRLAEFYFWKLRLAKRLLYRKLTDRKGRVLPVREVRLLGH